MSSIDPGPWALIPPVPYDGDDDELEGSFIEFACIEASNGNPVCVLGDAGGSGTMFENMANAQLIVTAPDMLTLLHQYVSDLRYPPTGDSIQRRIERAEAVIAKALGK